MTAVVRVPSPQCDTMKVEIAPAMLNTSGGVATTEGPVTALGSIPTPHDPAQVPAIRKPLSKRVRFEVFKRDGFTCQYCGATPPAVTLEPDHIIPVVDGGTNDPMNLITACFDCNRGKAAKRLGDIRPTPDAELARLQKLQELGELRAYQDAADAVSAARSEIVESLCDLWCECWNTSYPPADAIRRWVQTYGPDETKAAIEIGERKRGTVSGNHDRQCYIGAILRNRKNARDGKTCDTCHYSLSGDNDKMGCINRPFPGEADRHYIVYPTSSCAQWEKIDGWMDEDE